MAHRKLPEVSLRTLIKAIEGEVLFAEYTTGKGKELVGEPRIRGQNEKRTTYTPRASYTLNKFAQSHGTKEITFTGGWPHLEKGDRVRAHILAAKVSGGEYLGDDVRSEVVYERRELGEREEVIMIEKLGKESQLAVATYGELPLEERIVRVID